MSILIGADIVPTESNIALFQSGNISELIGEELCQIFEAADYRIFNLEVPLTDEETPIEKDSPNLIAPTASAVGLKALNIDLVGLSNNHIMDQDEQGLKSTVSALKKTGINFVGVGDTVESAKKPFIFDCGGKKIGVYACTKYSCATVSDVSAGANPFDPLESLDHIAELKKHCDYVIVLYHGGKESYRYPSPNLQKIFRKMADKGADLVIAQHTHCIGCEEKYKNATLVYGQGNFLFDYGSLGNIEVWQTGLLIRINDDFSIEYLPLVKNKNTVRLATGEKADEILSQFRCRSDSVKTTGELEKCYREFAEERIENYLWVLLGKYNLAFRVLNRLFGQKFRQFVLRKKYTKRYLLMIQNIVEDAAHRELFLMGIQSEIDNQHGKDTFK